MGHIEQLTFFPMEEYQRADLYPRDTKKWHEFMRFHHEHPEVYETFGQLAKQVRDKGFRSIGAHLLIQRMRWECYMEKKDREYKICNNHFPYYARLFIMNNPDYEGFFELRKLKE